MSQQCSQSNNPATATVGGDRPSLSERHAARIRAQLASRCQPEVPPLRSAAQSTTAVPSYEEQRFARRRPAKTKGFIIQQRGGQPVTCFIRDTSSTGALIQLETNNAAISRTGEHISVNFTLQMPLERVEVDCEMVWRKGNRIGARFTSPTRTLGKVEYNRPAQKPQPKQKSLVGRLFQR